LSEAEDSKYFIDGFMIKHFGIYPIEFEKDNLFEEQKIFLIYLIGVIPTIENWSIQVDYKQKLQEIHNIKEIRLEKTDIDLAILQGRDIEEIKRERLQTEKEQKIKELNKKFGIKETIKEETNIEMFPENKNQDNKEKLWDMLQARGLTGNGL